jgi:hypothetical protein
MEEGFIGAVSPPDEAKSGFPLRLAAMNEWDRALICGISAPTASKLSDVSAGGLGYFLTVSKYL